MDSDEEDFVTYGNPLDPIDEDTLPSKKSIKIEEQYAVDEHGRRRFHGAFTGGFSAGFCNSVGSLGGWEPTNFISSRNSRTEIKSQNAFDFMDDEDRGEHGICPMSVKVKPEYDVKSSDFSSRKRIREIISEGSLSAAPVVQQLFAPVRHTVGVKLLMKMGWKPEQGVGPRLTKAEKKLRKKTQEYVQKVYGCQLPTNVESKKDAEESDESDLDINLDEITFAPDDYKSYVLELKQNTFGLGYKGMDRKNILSSNKPEFSKLTVNGKTIRGQAFGVGILEDDDDDIYFHDDMSDYDFSLGPSNKEKNVKKQYSLDDGCIEGFHVSIKANKIREKFSLPVIPNDWNSTKSIFPETMTEWEVEREKSEFVKAAKLYRPLSDDMANRFTVGSQEDVHDILKPVEKTVNIKDQAMKEAATRKLYGPLTRKKFSWIPDRVLCKRFNIPEPISAGTLQVAAETTKHKNHGISIFEVLKSDLRIEAIKKDWSNDKNEIDNGVQPSESMQVSFENEIPDMKDKNEENDIDDKIAGITEKVDLFKAIFLSSSDDEDEEKDNTPAEFIPIPKEETENEIKKKSDKISYSPPRGIFTNLDLDSLRYKPNISKNTEIIEKEEKINTTSDIKAAEIDPQMYGPQIPMNLIRGKVARPSHIFKTNSKEVNSVWVEKNRKHKKKHKKHKKHK